MRARLLAAVPALRVVGFVLSVALVAAIGVEAARAVPAHGLHWAYAAWALPAAMVWWTLLAAGWGILAEGRPTRAAVSTWCRTQALRYLPGGIWAPVSRVVATQGTWLDRVSTVAAENIVALCAALAIGGAAAGAGGRPAWLALIPLAGAPWLLSRFSAARTRVAPPRTLRATATNLVAFALYASAAVAAQAAVSGLHIALAVAGAAALAWAAGLVVIITPGGIGVRELAYVSLLAHHIPRADLAAGAVTLRAVTIAAEMLLLLALGRRSAAVDH
jgi:hypothetical protein